MNEWVNRGMVGLVLMWVGWFLKQQSFSTVTRILMIMFSLQRFEFAPVGKISQKHHQGLEQPMAKKWPAHSWIVIPGHEAPAARMGQCQEHLQFLLSSPFSLLLTIASLPLEELLPPPNMISRVATWHKLGYPGVCTLEFEQKNTNHFLELPLASTTNWMA